LIERILLFGAGGDLAGRYLLPAVARLEEAGRLPDAMTILATGRSDWDTDGYRRRIGEKLERHAADLDPAIREAMLARLDYRKADATSPDDVRDLLDVAGGPLVAYLALPPGIFAPAIEALRDAGLPEGSRIVVEKPFGEDLESAERLNDLLHEAMPEEAVFRIDHFLQKQTVQNVLGLRFANRIFEPLWNGQNVEQVEITWDETLGLEGRAGYYDGAGAPSAGWSATRCRTGPSVHATRRGGSTARMFLTTPTRRGSIRAGRRRRSRRSPWPSTTGAGPGCPSSSGLARDWAATCVR
jgi:glucose-6-phosphate 1-dehydrogenase